MGIPTGFQKSSVHDTLTGSEPEFVPMYLLPNPQKSKQNKAQCRGANLYQPAGLPSTDRHTQRTAPDTILSPNL